MQKIRKIHRVVSEKPALPTNQPTNQRIITNNTDFIGPDAVPTMKQLQWIINAAKHFSNSQKWNICSWTVKYLRSQETLKPSHLKNVFFPLHFVETSFGNAYTKFCRVWTSDIDTVWLRTFKYFFNSIFFNASGDTDRSIFNTHQQCFYFICYSQSSQRKISLPIK